MSGIPSQHSVVCDECGKRKKTEERSVGSISDHEDVEYSSKHTFNICPTSGCIQRKKDRWRMREWELQNNPELDASPEVREREIRRIEEEEEERLDTEREDLPSYLDVEEDQKFADAERAATQVPQLAAILNGEDNEQAEEFRREADKLDRDPDEYVPTTAARHLYDFARHHPDLVAAHAGTIVEYLDTEDESIRRRIAFAVMDAATEPEPFVEYASEFITLLNHDDSVVQGTAAFVIGGIATVSPDDVVPAVGALIPLVDDPSNRADATSALSRIGDERPEAITAAVQPVCHHFQALSSVTADPEPGDIRFRVTALEIIAHIAFAAPNTIDDVSEALIRAVQSQNGEVRFQATDTISILLTECTETFASLASYVPSCLNDEKSDVRRAAALGCIRIGVYLPELVDDPVGIAERLRVLNTEFDDLPAEALEQALQNFDAAIDETH